MHARSIVFARGVSIFLCFALVVSGLPLQAVRYLETGRWDAGDTVALGAGSSTIRVTLTSTGAQLTSNTSNGQDAYVQRIVSNDGRYVVFSSGDPSLPGITGGTVFVRDTQAGTTTVVSVTATGAAAGGTFPSISGDGRYVVFESGGADLVSGDTNGVSDIFVRDLVAGTTVRASVTSAGAEGPHGSTRPYVSADGRYVAFESGNLGGPAPGGGIYLRDLVSGTTDFISIGRDGAVANDTTLQPTVSDDGRYVAFFSQASNLSPTPKLNNPVIFDVYLRDRSAGTTTRVSVGPGGVQGNSQSNAAVVSGDGRYVLFRSGAENLVSGDANGLVDLILRDLNGSLTTRIVEGSDGGSISPDGRFIVFESTQNGLVPGDTNGTTDVFIRDQQEGTTELVDQSSAGAIGNGGAQWPSLSADGRFVAFTSVSTNLVAGDTNGVSDIFLRDRGPVDAGAAAPYTYGDDPHGAYSPDNVNVGTGVYTTAATDLALPGRLLPLVFGRSYNSADSVNGPLGPGWSHSFYWKVVDAGGFVTLRRGDGQRDRFTRNANGTYAAPPNVFDTLTKNGDATFTLTLRHQTKYEFSTAGQLTRIHEPAGNQITLAYTSGNLTTITDTVGRAVTLAYDASSRLTQVQDPLGRKVTYAYDSSGRLATVTDKTGNAAGQDPALHRWQYAYEGTTQHLTTITDPDGRVRITNRYDASGRVDQQRDGLSQLTTLTYGTETTTIVDARGNSSTQTYDARKRALVETRVVSGQTLTLTYVYDAAGNLTSATDRNGKTTDYSYDTRGNVLTKTDPQVDPLIPRFLTQFAYDGKNNPTQLTDPRSFVTTFAYDATTNVAISVARQIDATSAVTKYEYGDVANKGLPTKVIAPRGNLSGTPDYAYATTLAYDAQGNLSSRLDPDGARTTWTYDAAGRQLTRVDPDGNAAGSAPADHTWTRAYDENDGLRSETDPLGAALAYTYDRTGNRATVSDRNGNQTTYGYDANARLTSTQQKPDPAGPTVYTTQVIRDPNGNATRVTQANGVVTDYGYDALDRLVSFSTHPDGSTTLTTAYALDGNGNLLTRTTPAPELQVTTYTYDALSRLKTVSATGLAAIAYDYNATSQRTQTSDGTGLSAYQYDGLGRLTQAAQPNGTLGYGYDRDGNRTSIVYPAGADAVTYVYTAGGRLDHLTDAASRTSTYTYSPSGLVRTLLAPNALQTTYGYDRAQRLTAVVNSVGPAPRTRHVYTLDKEGNRTALDEFVEGLTAAPSTTWAASAQVNGVGTGVQDHPAIALGADGAGYLIWDDARSGNADIRFSRRDPATGTWSADVKVNNDTGSRQQLNPAVSVDAANNAHAVWQDERNGAGKPDIYYSKRTASTGTWLSPNLKLNDDAGGGGGAIQRNPRLAGTAAGAQTAVWVDLRSSQQNVFSSQLAAGGSSWGANKPVTDNTAAVKDFPDVAVGADGTAYAVWQDSRGGNADIYFAKLRPGASAWTANVKISDDPGTAAQHHPRLGIDAAGNVIAVWLDDRTTPAQLRLSRLPSGSNAWSASSVVADAAARPLSVALAVRADGQAVVAFHDNRGASTDIYTSEYDPWSNTWTTSALASDDPGAAAQESPTVAFSTAESVAAWRDDRSGNADVRARRATLTGIDHFGLSYDGLERLTGVSTTNPESFTLDAGSNIASRTGPAATFSYDTAGRLTGDGVRTFTWSVSDRLTARGSDTFGYDPLDRLTSSTVAGTARTYGYNGDGLLQSRTQAGATTNLLWDPLSSPSHLLQIGPDRIVYGLGPVYVVKADGTTRALARDGMKSIRAEVDLSGAVIGSWRYRAYGETAQSSGSGPTILGYAGQLADPSGLIYLRARWYDPETGRFVSRDPVSGTPELPFSLNAYSYAGANPARFSDSSGRFCVPCLLILAPAATAACVRLCPAIQTAGVSASQWLLRAAALATAAVTVGVLLAEEEKHDWIPEDEIKKVDEHKVKKEYNVPKGQDLAWDQERNVYVHPKGKHREPAGPGEDLEVKWDELVREFPKTRGRPW